MKTLNYNWIYDQPHDYELKKYIFLAMYKKFKNNINNNELFSTLIEIELHLDSLFKFKYESQTLENKTIIGLDLDLMDLAYTKEGTDNTLFEITEYAILKLEKLHKKLRSKWITISTNIHLTEIPDKKPTKDKGIIFIILKDHIDVYSYIKPNPIDDDWKTFQLNKIGKIDNSLRKIAEFISMSENVSHENRFWRCDIKDINFLNIPYEDTILPIVTYNIFHKLKVI